jgi:hypothetical protein
MSVVISAMVGLARFGDDQDADGTGAEHTTPETASVMNLDGGGAAVAGDGHRRARHGRGQVGGGCQSGGRRPGGDHLDHFPGQHRFGRPVTAPQPDQHRQRDGPVQERQGDHDRGDDEGVAAGEFLVALGHLQRAVVAPVRRIDAAAAAAEQGAVNGDHQRCADWNQVADDQPQHGAAHGVRVPARGGEEPVRPAVMPHPGQPCAGQHAARRSARRLGDHPGQ